MSIAKNFWCPQCKEYPDEIIEHYHHVMEERRWDGDWCYELVDSDFGEVTETTCKKCGSNLKDVIEGREEGGEKDDKEGL